MAKPTFAWLRAMAVAVPFVLSQSARAADEQKAFAIAKIQLTPDRAELRRLSAAGYDIAGVNLKTNTADIILQGQKDSLSVMALGLNVLGIRSIDALEAPDSSYKTPEKVTEIIQSWVRQYPTLAHLESLGKSLNGRDIWGVRITNEATGPAKKPTVLFNAEHHAREVMTVEVVLDTGDYLLSNYGKDPKVTKWVDDSEIWLIPMVNPDGSSQVWSGKNMWRKNNRGNYGVDINRNYPFKWAGCGGSSAFPWAADYHGAAAASEPETQVMMQFIQRTQPVFNISYHSYSEIVIYPYGCDGQHAETRDVVEPIGQAMAESIPSETGDGTYRAGTAWELLYDVDGSDIDWMYHDHHVLAYCIEVTSDQSGFQPPFSHRQSTVESVRPAWQLLLDKLDQSGIRGWVHDKQGHDVTDASVAIKGNNSFSDQPGVWRLKQNGSFHAILNPGNYHVSITINGKTVDRDVTVGDKVASLDIEI